MNEFNFSHLSDDTSNTGFQQPKLISIILKLKDAYGIWQKYLPDFPKTRRFTIGSKIDCVFLDAIEYSFRASYSTTDDKIKLLDHSITSVDLLKLLMQLAWENNDFDIGRYNHMGQYLFEIGKMQGGWRRQLLNKTPRSDI
jgi:hypothetical protein